MRTILILFAGGARFIGPHLEAVEGHAHNLSRTPHFQHVGSGQLRNAGGRFHGLFDFHTARHQLQDAVSGSLGRDG
jgi:hypothetical protein